MTKKDVIKEFSKLAEIAVKPTPPAPSEPPLNARDPSQMCGGCYFGLATSPTTIFCRRHPPMVFLHFRPDGNYNVTSQFPPMQIGGWCGDFSPGDPEIAIEPAPGAAPPLP